MFFFICTDLEVLLTKQGNDFLSKVERDTKAVIQRDWRTCCLFIFGSDAVKTRAKTAINDFISGNFIKTYIRNFK